MSRFDEDLRSTLRGGTPPVDVEAFLGDVHRGARRRRQRRAVGISAAAVLVVAGAAGVLLPGQGPDSAPPVTATSTPATPAPTPSPTPTSRPSASPPAVPRPTGVPTDEAGNPLETGVVGFDAPADGTLWRVSAVGCGGSTLCSRVSSYGGNGAWTTLTDLAWAHPAPGEPSAPALDVTVAPDGQDAWAYGGAVWSTHDGGQTWTAVHPPLQGSGAGEMAVVGDEAVLRSNQGHLMRSPVGRDDWSTLPLPAGMSYAEQVVAVGNTLLVRGRDAGFAMKVATSDDGGDTWTAATAPCDPEQPPYDVVGGAVLAYCAASPTAPLDVLRSDDTGRTWHPVVTVRVKSLDAAVPMDASTVYAVTGSGELVVFPEGEKQYGDVVPLGTGGTVLGGRFVTPEHGYLLLGSPRRLLETTDGGQTWRSVG